MHGVFGLRAWTLSRASESTMSQPAASSPQTTLADVEQRIVAAAKEREDMGAESRSQALAART